MKIRVWGTTN